jgi:hypothetical protein
MSHADPSITVADLVFAGVKRISVGGSIARYAMAAFLKAGREMKDQGCFTFIRTSRRHMECAMLPRHLRGHHDSSRRMKISTRNLQGLADVARLKHLLQSIAMLDAILIPECECRYYSFYAHSGEADNGVHERWLRGEFVALLNSHGAFLKGFAHASPAAAVRTWFAPSALTTVLVISRFRRRSSPQDRVR